MRLTTAEHASCWRACPSDGTRVDFIMDILESRARSRGYLAWAAELIRNEDADDGRTALQALQMVVDKCAMGPLERANGRRVNQADPRPWGDLQFRQLVERALDCWPVTLGGYCPNPGLYWPKFLDAVRQAIHAR